MSLPRDIEGVRLLAEKLAREHAAKGGKVVGYATPSVPAELIRAAGLWPIMLSGGTERSTALGDRVMEDLFDRSLRAVFERLLKGEFDYLSAIVLPRANDSAHRLYYYLCEQKRTGEAKLPPILLCDVVMTPDAASLRYSTEAIKRLKAELVALGGGKTYDLIKAMERTNLISGPISTMIGRRRFTAMPGAEALAAFAAARMLPYETFAAGVPALLARRTDIVGPRLIVCGSVQHDAGLHGLIEAAGGTVTSDYHAGGDFSNPFPGRRAILDQVVEMLRYELSASRRVLDQAAHTRDYARDSSAQGAIFSYFPEEEALTWDYPEQKAALESIGIQVLRLPDQTWPFDVEGNRAVVTAFVKGLGA